jgi:hypothetical protein
VRYGTVSAAVRQHAIDIAALFIPGRAANAMTFNDNTVRGGYA